jgi:dTDP-4-dehydrorhamnose 3,5-epimerase
MLAQACVISPTMDLQPLSVAGTWLATPRQHADDRGVFLEWFRGDTLADRTGATLAPLQANLSVSGRGVLRGVHYADVPPGQAKWVTCLSGAVLEVVVDLRTGSPTFGRCEAVRLDGVDRRAVFLPEGLGHAFLALEDGSVVAYLCSTSYNPQVERAVSPLDPDLDIAWPAGIEPRLSPKDAAAPTLAESLEAGLLPSYDDCLALPTAPARD